MSKVFDIVGCAAIVLVALASGGAVGWVLAAMAAIGGWWQATVAEIEPVSSGVRYRRWRRWNQIPYSKILAVKWPVFGSTHLRLKRQIPPWGRLYFQFPVGIFSPDEKRRFLEKIEAGILASQRP